MKALSAHRGNIRSNIESAYRNQLYGEEFVYQTFNPGPAANTSFHHHLYNETLGNPRVAGTLQGVGGLAEAGVGALGVAAFVEPASTIGGAIAVGHGLDNAYTGFRTAYTGEFQTTQTAQKAAGLAAYAGADQRTAQYFGTAVDFGVGFASGVGASRAFAARGVAPASVARTNAQLVDDIGTRAGQWAQRTRQQTTLANASPQTIGVKQHDYARRVLDRYQSIYGQRGLSTDVRYRNGVPWRNGDPLKGSIRLDVVEGPLNNPTAVFDYKFGNAGLTTGRVNQIRAGAGLQPNVPIIEVRP